MPWGSDEGDEICNDPLDPLLLNPLEMQMFSMLPTAEPPPVIVMSLPES